MNNLPDRGLVIDEPWISKILAGEKIWEMRSSNSKIRGRIGLIRKGSGMVVGSAEMTGSEGPFDNAGLASTRANHCIPDQMIEAPDYKWRYAWKLKDVEKFVKPVPYKHKPGAVIWVNLSNS